MRRDFRGEDPSYESTVLHHRDRRALFDRVVELAFSFSSGMLTIALSMVRHILAKAAQIAGGCVASRRLPRVLTCRIGVSSRSHRRYKHRPEANALRPFKPKVANTNLVGRIPTFRPCRSGTLKVP
jgi:hypothetical protein